MAINESITGSGLGNDEREIWNNYFGTLLTKAEGLALIPVEELEDA